MKHDQHSPDEHELQMLAHFRAHSAGEPSAELDARILAAANVAAQAAAVSDKQPSWSERLHAWLFGTGRQRWSLALAGVACLGIGVSLTWRSLEQAPGTFDAVPTGALMAPATTAARQATPAAPLVESAPADLAGAYESQAAPAIQAYSADAAKAEKKSAPPEMLREEASSPALADQPAQATPAPRALAKSKAQASNQTKQVEAEQALQAELQRLLKLRREGWNDEADALLLKLMRAYPQVDIDAQLQQLEKAD